MRLIFLSLILLSVLPFQSWADSDNDEIQTILSDIITGWEAADGKLFRKHFLDYDGARYIESGGQNVGLTDLVEHHVEPEGKSIQLDLNFNNPAIHIEGDFAWVIVDTEVKGTILKSGRKIHNRGYETIILKKISGTWKVIHTHSSGKAVTVEG